MGAYYIMISFYFPPMTPYQQLNTEFKRERMILSTAFVVMVVVIGALYAINHTQEISMFAAQAYENPTKVFSSVIRGMAQ